MLAASLLLVLLGELAREVTARAQRVELGSRTRGTGGAIKDPQDIRGNMKSITKKDNYEDS